VELVSLRDALERDGWTTFRAKVDVAASPWDVARELFGEPIEMVERQPIRPVRGGRSFASTDVFTPLHTDSQPYLGAPPCAQVMICVRPAARGGETILADGWRIAEDARDTSRSERDLDARLFDEPRTIPFYFGDVRGPTIARWRGRVAFTHSPVAPRDDLARRVRALVDAAPVIELRPRAGDAFVVDNHRMLHGRRAFDDPSREFVRFLVWLARPLAVPASIASRARDVAPQTISRIEDARHIAIVHEMLAGAAPGILSARERVPESELYRWRDAVCAREAARAPNAPIA